MLVENHAVSTGGKEGETGFYMETKGNPSLNTLDKSWQGELL